jgi:hypothetical protein
MGGVDAIYEGDGTDPLTKYQTETEVLGTIATEVPTESAQFSTETGIAYLDTPFLPRTVTSVTFNRSQIFGEETLPIYNFLSISKTGAKHENKCLVIHSSLIVPEILVANKPISLLPTYADQATMTADFAAQVEGEYYYYTGSTSAWLFDGTETDSIDNYEELEEIAGWEEWGTRPNYLIIKGNYLLGSANINYLHFQYFKSKPYEGFEYDNEAAMLADQANQEIGKYYYYTGVHSLWLYNGVAGASISNYKEYNLIDFVECNVVSLENGNLDPNAILLHKIVDNQYNEGIIVGDDTIINDSIYADSVQVLLNNVEPSDPLNVASYADLGGGNFAIQTVMNPNATSGFNGFTTRFVPNIELINRLMSLEKFTFFARLNFPNVGQTSNTIRFFQNNAVTSPTSGIRLRLRTDLTFDVTLWRATGATGSYLSSVSFPLALDSNFDSICVQVYKTESNQYKVDAWIRSVARSYAFTKVIDATNTNTDISINTGLDFLLDGIAGSGVRAKKVDQQYIYLGKIFTESEVEAILNEMEGV